MELGQLGEGKKMSDYPLKLFRKKVGDSPDAISGVWKPLAFKENGVAKLFILVIS
ncbi:MAG: hypothetical protein ISR65_20470 [Bacteriovoracaceae bacterium]|nr:hypothetical protein [Bacteriovoracaceae bacterium]